MEQRLYRQLRVIRKYASVKKIDMELAAKEWCRCGLAAKWAKMN